jgi:LmbE family N-acetylglucosaminyl deacetylase
MTDNLTRETIIPASVLVIAAHPDDIEFGVSGSVAHWTQAGAKVTYCIVTDGSAGSNDPTTDLEDLIEQRREEQRRSAAVVGVTDVRFMDYRDGTLQPTLELRRDLTRLIRQIKPERVVIFDPTTVLTDGNTYINHPDHRAAGEAALYAVFPSAESRPIFPELLAEGLEPHKVSDLYITLTNQANVYVDISPYIEQKLAALRCHKTQFGEEVVQMVKKWNAEEGQKYNCAYVESFRVMNFRPNNNHNES